MTSPADVDLDDEGRDDDAYPVGPSFMWLIYLACPVCGAEAKRPCVGQRFGPHEGRRAHWERD